MQYKTKRENIRINLSFINVFLFFESLWFLRVWGKDNFRACYVSQNIK